MMRQFIILATIAVSAIAMPVWATENLVFDTWWSVDYARDMCRYDKSFLDTEEHDQETMDIHTACLGSADAGNLARQYEDAIKTQIEINPVCRGVTFTRYSGPGSKEQPDLPERYATLLIDYIPGAQKQSWTMIRHPSLQSDQAEGSSPARIAADVCAILTTQGGAAATDSAKGWFARVLHYFWR